MTSPPSNLLASLTDLGPQHPRVSRLRGVVGVGSTEGGLATLGAELMAEAAASLGRAERRVLDELQLLKSLRDRIDHLEAQLPRKPATRDLLRGQVEAFNRHRALAERRRWELLVQREAVGFKRNEILERLYPVPPRRELPEVKRGLAHRPH
jgi:enoyl-CoA hydratase/carnithine racemase